MLNEQDIFNYTAFANTSRAHILSAKLAKAKPYLTLSNVT